jgi:polyisoprenoid-binding protein YceI
MRRALPLAALILSAPLIAQGGPPQLPGKADPARVTAGSYAVESTHALIAWKVDHFGFNDYFGIFGDPTGTLELDPKNVEAAKLDITIPVSKVTTASKGLTDHLLRPGKDGGKPDFFGAAPADAKFVSTKVTKTGDMTATIEGNLTLNGATKPVTINATFTGAGINPFNKKETVGFRGTASLMRSEWGIGYAIPLVSDRVDLGITVAFEK